MIVLTFRELSERALVFERGPDPGHPFQLELDRRLVLIRLGDFPVEPMYTLVVDGVDVDEFDGWPHRWERPETTEIPVR